MRTIILGMTLFMETFLFLMLILTIDSSKSRRNELETAVDMSLTRVVERVEQGDIDRKDFMAMKSAFVERINGLINSDSEVDIRRFSIENEGKNEVVYVVVEESFYYPSGKKGVISYKKNKTL